MLYILALFSHIDVPINASFDVAIFYNQFIHSLLLITSSLFIGWLTANPNHLS